MKILLETLKQIENDSWVIRIRNEDKPKVRSLIQINIISQIVLYCEDLAVIAESFRQGISFFEFLDRKNLNDKDVGEITNNFFTKIDTLSDEDICRIMSWMSPAKTDWLGSDSKLVKRYIEENIKEVKRVLKQFGDFSKSNHPVFRRFKHAGLPIFPGLEPREAGFLTGYDSVTLVSKGPDPLNDVIPIPYSKEVLDAYDIIINGMQGILQDVVKYRIMCMERKIDGLIPPVSYTPFMFSFDERTRLQKIIDEYILRNPPDNSPISLKYNKKLDKSDFAWYLELPQFMSACKEIKEKLEAYDRDYKLYLETYYAS